MAAILAYARMLFSCRNLSRHPEFVVLKHTGALPISLDDFFSLGNAMVLPNVKKEQSHLFSPLCDLMLLPL